MLGVNVKGVAWMMRTFVPVMQAQATPSVFCTTASILGIIPMSSGVYGVSKVAAVSMCELLQKELDVAGDTHVSVHCLCPPIANTNILQSARNRPDELGDSSRDALDPEQVGESLPSTARITLVSYRAGVAGGGGSDGVSRDAGLLRRARRDAGECCGGHDTCAATICLFGSVFGSGFASA